MNAKPCRVLIVEDEALVAMLLEDMLTDLGFEVVGSATKVQSALAIVAHQSIDFAVLDINLGSEQSFPVAHALREKGIPFLFATGYGVKGLSDQFRDSLTLQKPFEQADLSDAISKVVARS